MLFSEVFGVSAATDDDWFDPIVNADTELFVDPFLIFGEQTGFWSGAHDVLISHFDQAFKFVAESGLKPAHLAYKKAVDMLVFREPHELCLGYTARGTAGAGSGTGYARLIAAAISEAIRRGLHHPKHFEELGVLQEGIGADRISDITCTILKARIIEYTQQVARRHGIPCASHRIFASSFDPRRKRWNSDPVEVPTNPTTGGPLLLVPKRFLRDLPSLNDQDWWDYYENEKLRTDLNYEIQGHVDKKTIVGTARRHPDLVRQWAEAKDPDSATPYDLARDQNGVYRWDQEARRWADAHPQVIAEPSSEAEFIAVIELIIGQFKLFIEEQGGWSLLWDKGHKSEKPEAAAQLLFRGIAQHYCRANNISLDAEVNLGRGPVDFKFSRGYRRRAHLEVKKVHNGRFWNGLREQLPSYMRSDEVNLGWFLAVLYRDAPTSAERVRGLPAIVRSVEKERGIRLRPVVMDGRPKESASKL